MGDTHFSNQKQLEDLPQILSNHEALNSFTLEVTQAVIEAGISQKFHRKLIHSSN